MDKVELRKMIEEEVLLAVSRLKDTLLLSMIGFMEQEKYEMDHNLPKQRLNILEENVSKLEIGVPDEEVKSEEEDENVAPSLQRASSSSE
jgi:hypothetical protein